MPDFSIITPSFCQPGWLKRCVRAVGDQGGVEVEHLVQDGRSGGELEAWVRGNSKAGFFAEADEGMYDAINKGLGRAKGDFFAILNCDEQYLPGTLARVKGVFEANPGVDIVAGDYLVVDGGMEMLAYRKVTRLRRAMILTDHLYAFTCALFFRRSILAEGLRFDARLKSVADGDFVCRALERGHRAMVVPGYLATFAWTGENLSAREISREEERAARAGLPAWMRVAGPFLRQWRHVERLMAGGYSSGAIEYAVYRREDDTERTTMRCERPGFRYPGG